MPKKKLDWVKVRDLRREYATGEFTVIALAEDWDLTPSYVSKIVRRIVWDNLDGLPVITPKRGRPTGSKTQTNK